MNKLYESKYCVAYDPKISEDTKIVIMDNIEPIFKGNDCDCMLYDLEVVLERHEIGEMRLPKEDYDLLCEIIKEADFIEF